MITQCATAGYQWPSYDIVVNYVNAWYHVNCDEYFSKVYLLAVNN